MQERGEGELVAFGIAQGLSSSGGMAVEAFVKALGDEGDSLVNFSALLGRKAGGGFVGDAQQRQQQR